MPIPVLANEAARLDALEELEILDTLPEESFDRITRIASQLFGTPIALVSLVDEARQWFKSRVGLDATQTPREHAFCAHAIAEPRVMVVDDALEDPRFRDNPLVTGGPRIRFYAGAPLALSGDLQLGTLCVIDQVPRSLDEKEKASLSDLAALVVDEMHLRRQLARLNRARSELLRINEELDTFSHAVAHDLAAPLRHAAFFSERLREDHADELSEGAVAKLAKIEEVTRRATEMLRELGRLGRLENPDALRRSDVDVATLVRDLEDEAKHATGAKDATVELELELETAIVHAHPIYLREVFANLIQNALKYGGEPARVTVGAVREEDGSWRLHVADNGRGIAEKDRERVFRPFFQLDPGANKGSGFGLAFVRKLVALHGGRIWVEDAPGGGASFCFTIAPPAKAKRRQKAG